MKQLFKLNTSNKSWEVIKMKITVRGGHRTNNGWGISVRTTDSSDDRTNCCQKEHLTPFKNQRSKLQH